MPVKLPFKGSFCWLHSDRHPQPVHKATLKVRAKAVVGKNSLLRLPGHLLQLLLHNLAQSEFTGEAAAMNFAAATVVMASHWPPENLPMREVELLAGGLHLHGCNFFLWAGGITHAHSGLTPVCCCYLNKQFNRQRFMAIFPPISQKQQ